MRPKIIVITSIVIAVIVLSFFILHTHNKIPNPDDPYTYDQFGYDRYAFEQSSDEKLIDIIMKKCMTVGRQPAMVFYNGTHHIDTSTCKLQKVENVCDMTKKECSHLPLFKKIIPMPNG